MNIGSEYSSTTIVQLSTHTVDRPFQFFDNAPYDFGAQLTSAKMTQVGENGADDPNDIQYLITGTEHAFSIQWDERRTVTTRSSSAERASS